MNSIQKKEVHSLICHRDIAMACACLGSLLRNVPVDLILHDDGTLTAEDCDVIAKALPRSKIIMRSDADREIRDFLRLYPHSARAREDNCLMMKLFDVAFYSHDSIAYCDTDILFYHPVEGLFDLFYGRKPVFMHDGDHAYSVRPWHLHPIGELRLPAYLNSGLFTFPMSAFDLEFCEWILGHESLQRYFQRISCWAEQTIWAALAFKAGCRFYDRNQLEMVGRRWKRKNSTIAAHFVRSYRHMLWDELAQRDEENHAATAIENIRTFKMSECNAGALGLSQAMRRLRRFAGSTKK